MAGTDDLFGDVDPAPHETVANSVDRSLGHARPSGEFRLRAINGGDVFGQIHHNQTRQIRRVRQAVFGARLCLASYGYLPAMSRKPIQSRWDRWSEALKAARAVLERVSNDEVARRIEEIGEGSLAPRSVARFVSGEADTSVGNVISILAAVPEAGDAFEDALREVPINDATAASWGRLGRRLAAVMDVEAGHRLVDAIEDLAGLGPLDTTWTPLRDDATLARRILSADRAVRDLQSDQSTNSDI